MKNLYVCVSFVNLKIIVIFSFASKKEKKKKSDSVANCMAQTAGRNYFPGTEECLLVLFEPTHLW